MSKERQVSDLLISWYRSNARILPWRETKDPYKIWLSEIILQQTTVRQGLPYYNKFISAFPSLEDLALADLDEVLKLWQGLGYYSRARNLHETARYIKQELYGVFPSTYKGLLKLKGVGKYTAAAIASFCYSERVAVVDGNVKRGISRLYGIEDAVDKTVTEERIRRYAQRLQDPVSPDEFNQAIMEFGALQCTKHNPLCSSCPMNSLCLAFKKGLVEQIPSKSKKPKKRDRFFYFAYIIDSNGFTLIQQRNEKDIWKGLYQFPLLEKESLLTSSPDIKAFGFNFKLLDSVSSKIYKHSLSHQNIKAQFISFRLDDVLSDQEFENTLVIHKNELENYAVPRLIDLYLSDLSITLF